MNIYTSYFGNIRTISPKLKLVSVARTSPIRDMPIIYALVPPWPLLKWFKSTEKTTEDIEQYTQCYQKEVLASIRPQVLLKHLEYISKGRDIVLLCYERPEAFCHRHLIADWLQKAGIECKEF